MHRWAQIRNSPTVHNLVYNCLDVWHKIKREFWLEERKAAAPIFCRMLEIRRVMLYTCYTMTEIYKFYGLT